VGVVNCKGGADAEALCYDEQKIGRYENPVEGTRHPPTLKAYRRGNKTATPLGEVGRLSRIPAVFSCIQ
jgi:hypothetical protein